MATIEAIRHIAKMPVLFDSSALLWFHSRKRENLADCVRSWPFGLTPEPLIARDYQHMLAITGWDRLRSGLTFLNVPPIDWLTCTEPQITGGWAHHLLASNSALRCQAMFDALASLVPGASQVNLEHVDAVLAEDGRVDLLVVATDVHDTIHAICIEAKFGHFVTEGQLDRSANYVLDKYKPSSPTCLIIGPALTPNIASMSANTESEVAWSFASWKRFLIAYENALPSHADGEAFRQFRSTNHARSQREFS